MVVNRQQTHTTTSQRFQDQVVLITGGTSGIGATTASLFLAQGAKLFNTDLEERNIKSSLGSKNVDFYKCDVSSPEDCEAAVKACVDIHGRIDILFHNAGILCQPAEVPDQDVALFQKVLLTNLGGLFYLSRAAIPYMRKQGKGSIIATASTSGLSGAMALSPYAASKAGIINLVKTMALDRAKDGIRINAVAPGYTNTPMTAPFAGLPALRDAMLSRIPMGRAAKPEEVGRAVLFLASEDASFTTGHVLPVDGGTSADCSGAPDTIKHLAAMQG
ncbi:hypothetical protein LTR09_000293 [Extremus antarcticus]|uniref:Uncharacterized protein n=1 Tax=Extremus antarcticus TaxID=702011 RepID=A0AAJ0GJH8_9PEZI|nr:hypothetical protein LTR09_000293 [Extremus antarcticus]